MKFSEFYEEAQRELTSTFVSMHAKGRTEYADHLRWLFENKEEEKLVQEPVFQTIFPWEPHTLRMRDLTGLLGEELIDALDVAKFKEPANLDAKVEDMSFKKDIYPYKHQVESWRAVLEENKSILVTTGTGSGKTECFMVPILKDLLDERNRMNGTNPGVQAIFLYPLNALIASQRKRIHAWCDAVNQRANVGITYGVYTSDSEETVNAETIRNFHPQVKDRRTIRTNPPQILFTNPTMLEYMMVRNEDQELVNNSTNLKWIILDEAHTYNGSSAAELAILIKRVLQLFGKSPADVRFAITSATIGEGKEKEMREFISNLTGKDAATEFHFVSGRRIVPSVDEDNARYKINQINKRFGLNVSYENILQLRSNLNDSPALSLREICTSLGFNGTAKECLELVDELSVAGSVATVDGKETALLPVRAHFFGRGISGLYACTNHECPRYMENHIGIGTLTTLASQNCPHCGGKMLEVVKCGSCGEYLLQGERFFDNGPDPDSMVWNYSMKDNTIKFQHLLDADDDSDDSNIDDQSLDRCSMLLSGGKNDIPFEGAVIYNCSLDSMNGIADCNGTGYTYCNNPARDADDLLCPECGEKGVKAGKVMFPSALESRLLAHALLKQSPVNMQNGAIYEGRKYITFTDNRQSTASNTQSANIDVEREWMRSRILYDILNQVGPNNNVNIEATRQSIRELETAIQNNPNMAHLLEGTLRQLRETLRQQQEQLNNARPITSWDAFRHRTERSNEFERLQRLFGRTHIDTTSYLKAMFVDQMGNKPLRSNSLETLGLVHLEYPAIERLGLNDVPMTFVNFYGYADFQEALNDWKAFLRICIDYHIRRNGHIVIPDEALRLVAQRYFSDPIYPPLMRRVERDNGAVAKRWPQIQNNNGIADTIARLPLLLLLGNDICRLEELDANVVDSVNAILSEAWRFITRGVLVNVESHTDENGQTYYGYKLDIFDSERVKLSLIENVTVCPMTNQLLDCTFRGISPMAKGHLDPRTLEKYRIRAPFVDVPRFGLNEADYILENDSFDKDRWTRDVNCWFDNTFAPVMQSIAADSGIQRRLFIKRPVFITAEHSGQMESEVLRERERLFEEGKLNVLSCSTTMEMGVDIGGISAVLMNNVPPKPANYLQRAGRAGRRSETQSLSYTICNDNPVGREVLNNPKWALDHEIESPYITFSSGTILQRHINSLLLGEYIRECGGIRVSSNIGGFIYGRRNYDNIEAVACNYDGFITFLANARTDDRISDKIREITRGTAYENESIDNMISRCDLQISELCTSLKATIDAMIADMNSTRNTRYQNLLRLRINQLWDASQLTYLSGHNFLPSSSIPTNVVDLVLFETHRTNDGQNEKRKTIQRPLTFAVQEYAPGREVVVDNFVYPILGIEKKAIDNNNNSLVKYISKCDGCGYVSISNANVDLCPKCASRLSPIFNQLGTATLSVEPCGFVAGEGRRTKKPKKQTDFAVPELIGMERWDDDDNGDDRIVYRVRSSVHADAQILYVNKGKGYGYAFCEYCGKMVPETEIYNPYVNTPLPAAMIGHSNIAKDGRCYGNTIGGGVKRNVLLSACCRTDIAELDVRSGLDVQEHRSLLYTLGTIMASTFTQSLGVKEDEVWFGITNRNTLFFYDTASGGAGYACQLPMYIDKIFDKCLEKLRSCRCTTACTGCLIERRSQWFIEHLNKDLAIRWLENERNSRQDIPTELFSLTGSNEIRKVTRDFISEMLVRLRRTDYTSIEYFLPEGLDSDVYYAKFEQDFRKANLTTPVYMVVSKADADRNLSMAVRLSLKSYADRFSGLKAVESCADGITPLACLDNNGVRVLYIQYNGFVYSVTNAAALRLRDYDVVLQVAPTDYCFVYNFRDERVQSSLLLSTILGANAEKLRDFLAGKSNHVRVKYTDIYVSNPICCLILAHFLKRLNEEFGLEIDELTVETSKVFKSCYDSRRERFLDTDFKMATERDDYLRDTIDCNLPGLTTTVNSDRRLLHARLLEISNDEFELTVNPDGGFANGWKVFGAYTNTIQDDRSRSIELTNANHRDNLPIRFTVGWCER